MMEQNVTQPISRKILVITTKGCESCEKVKNLVQQGVTLSGKEVEVEFKDKEEFNKRWLSSYGIKDFPTIAFIKNEQIKFKWTGVAPAIVIARWIEVQLV